MKCDFCEKDFPVFLLKRIRKKELRRDREIKKGQFTEDWIDKRLSKFDNYDWNKCLKFCKGCREEIIGGD